MPDPDEHSDITTTATGPHGSPLGTSRRQPQLVIAWSDSRGPQQVTIADKATLGSSPEAGVYIADATVSRVHAEIDPREDGIWLRDLGSKNGTFVHGAMIRGGTLRVEGIVRLGAVNLIFSDVNPTTIPLWPRDTFGSLVGASPVMRELFEKLSRVSASDSTVLIRGESGSGKELVAQAIHDTSKRRGGPFIVVDCAAMPEQLVEAELFGNIRGAFTGATTDRAGAFESANGGTVLLDEVGELPIALQPKLLRVLETRSVRRVGESGYREIDARFIAATNRDLATMVNDGTFREDLFFRLCVLAVDVPPLRERRDDIPLLVRRFEHGDLVDDALLDELRHRPWPGNVRELRNFVERVAALGAADALALARQDASLLANSLAAKEHGWVNVVAEGRSFKDERERVIEQFERVFLEQLIARLGRNAADIASAAELNVAYVRKLLNRHGL